TAGNGIDAQSVSGAIFVTTAAVTASGTGISASSSGGGTVTVQTTGATMAGSTGILASTTSSGNVIVNAGASVTSTGSDGINAQSVSGTISMTTLAVTGNQNGISATSSGGGAITV